MGLFDSFGTPGSLLSLRRWHDSLDFCLETGPILRRTWSIPKDIYIYIYFTYTKVLITYYIISHHMTKCCWHVDISSFIWSLISRFVDSSIPLFLPSFVFFVDSLCITMQFFWGFLKMAAQVTMVFNINMVWWCDHHPSAGPLFQPSLRSSWLSPAGERRVASLPEQLKRVNVLMFWKSKIQTLMPFRHLEQKKPSETDDLGFFD